MKVINNLYFILVQKAHLRKEQKSLRCKLSKLEFTNCRKVVIAVFIVVCCIYFQVFDILADFNGTAICIMTIVMTCRKFALYRTVFQKIRELFPSFLPQYLMVDFEAAVRKAVHRVWPETRIVGCR